MSGAVIDVARVVLQLAIEWLWEALFDGLFMAPGNWLWRRLHGPAGVDGLGAFIYSLLIWTALLGLLIGLHSSWATLAGVTSN